jgi:hypothetical protein
VYHDFFYQLIVLLFILNIQKAKSLLFNIEWSLINSFTGIIDTKEITLKPLP